MAKARKAKAPYGTGVGELARKMITAGKTNQEIHTAIQKKFPESKLTLSGVSWYRNKMIRDGVKGIKTNTQIKAARERGGKRQKSAEDLAA